MCVDEHLRTNVPDIFAAGDLIGRQVGSQMATPVGSQDGGIVAHNALSGEEPGRVSHRVIPRAIFIDPPFAVVGMTEKEVMAAGNPCWCKPVPMALRFRARLRDFVEMLHVYPTMAEALKAGSELAHRLPDPDAGGPLSRAMGRGAKGALRDGVVPDPEVDRITQYRSRSGRAIRASPRAPVAPGRPAKSHARDRAGLRQSQRRSTAAPAAPRDAAAPRRTQRPRQTTARAGPRRPRAQSAPGRRSDGRAGPHVLARQTRASPKVARYRRATTRPGRRGRAARRW